MTARTPTRPDREVRVALDYSHEHAGAWRLTVECDDELTEMVFMNPPDGVVLPMPTEADLRSEEWVRRWIEEHSDRCESCQAWAKA